MLFFVNDQVDSNVMSMVYSSTEHMVAYLFTKSLQGELFVNFCEVIMGWKHIDTLQMGPPSNRECVRDKEEVESSREVIESNIETKDEKLVRKKLYVDIVIHSNKKRHNTRT